MNSNAPYISVVIPTHNRKSLLLNTLRGFQNQSYDKGRFELVVVDDGSTDGTREEIEAVLDRFDYPLRIAGQDKKGPASARNLGMSLAKGEIVAFTDDDCLPDPAWLCEISRAFSHPGTWAVSGRIFSRIPPGIFVHSLLSASTIVSESDHFMTGNFAVRKDAARRIGGFDPRFEDPWFEDYDFAYRIRDGGGEIATAADAKICHPPQYQSFFGYLRKTRFSKYLALMQVKHPGKGFDGAIRANFRMAAKTSLTILLFALAPLPWTNVAGRLLMLWGIAAFRAWRRVRAVDKHLKTHDFSVRRRDVLYYILFSWTIGLLHGWHTLLGTRRFGGTGARKSPGGATNEKRKGVYSG
jgi:glycosyltransferase involved in cell wall biosynthesis